MKQALFIILLICNLAYSQSVEKFREGYFIDKFDVKYSGLIMFEPGDGKKTGSLAFKESKKSKKESYGPDYIKTFVVEKDSFSILKNIPIGNKKVIAIDFVQVKLVGSGGVLYVVETESKVDSGQANTEYKVTEEKIKYIIDKQGKLILLNQNNMKEFASIVADHVELKNKILSRKIRFNDIKDAINDYKQFKSALQ